MSYRDIITIEPDKRGGKPCIRRMRITVYDVLGWLASGMSMTEIIDDFPELTETDIRACLEFVADRDRRLVASVSAAWNYYSIKSEELDFYFAIERTSRILNGGN